MIYNYANKFSFYCCLKLSDSGESDVILTMLQCIVMKGYWKKEVCF